MTDKQRLRLEIHNLSSLRNDAVARGDYKLAVTYGWSLMRLWNELMSLQFSEMGL